MVLQPAVKIALRDQVEFLEIVKDGEVLARVSPSEVRRRGGQMPQVTFDRSGWVLIRAVTDKPETYRFATTGPFYVEVGGQRRVSRRSAQFFSDWVEQRASQIDLEDDAQRSAVLEPHRSARRYWRALVKASNAQ